MTRENRTDVVVCPTCDNNPIVRADDVYFCDCCNQEFSRAELIRAP